ncbi:AMP-binding protein [Actinocorallia longicatena]|uniref:AMP-binding protein n=1 Tax=Actinocorallia longicatena TaxID=111803 RepID=A0ABP6QH39_9ACTN
MDPGARLVDAATGEISGVHEAEAAAGALGALPPGPLVLSAATDVRTALWYLGAVLAERPVILLDPALPAGAFAERFGAAAVLDSGGITERGPGAACHPDLAVLLATSGSTGDPKLVRLSRRAVTANAESIAEALGIDAGEVAPTTLPLYYSYGLSVLNSHVVRGATVVFEASGFMSRSFWDAVDAHRATSLAGVPAQYEMLRRLRFDPAAHPSLRALTQAGGRLRPELAAEFAARLPLHIMYGQTEATARMAVLPPEEFTARPGSAGRAIPGGSLEIRDEQVLYRGPNVMMGYAENAADLARGDDLGGVLATGDLGRLDADGYLTLTGRLKRIGKVFGTRLNLDDVERMAGGLGAVAAVSHGDRVVIWAERADEAALARAAGELADRLRLHHSGFDVRSLDALPLLGNGKIDYRALEALTE